MADAIFLSAGVPDPKRGPEYAATADTVAITASVSALVHVTLGRRLLVWGGQPAITPMIWVVAEDIGVDYGSWVRLYQSRHFQDDFPEDNERFQNVTYIDDVEKDREKSLRVMRERMFSNHAFKAAVFIGGMGGIVEEFELFRRLQPNAAVVPVVSTGGAVLKVAERLGTVADDLWDDLDYVALFHRYLGVSVREERFFRPENQPVAVDQRYWRPRDQVFICYGHKDIVWLRRLKTMLAPLIKDNIVNILDDTMISAGEKWREKIQVALKSAKVAVLLVSPEFLESEFIRNNELPHLLKVEEAGHLKVVWFPIASSLVNRTAISEYQAAIDPAKPLDSMRKPEQGQALERIARVIEEAYRK